MSVSEKDKEQEPEPELAKEVQQEASLADPGAMLSAAREEQGITISRVSRDLGLTESAVRDLEANKHDRFPAGIYVRGYIKNYCKILSLDILEVMKVLEEFVTLNGTQGSHGSNYDPLGEFGLEKKKRPPLIIPIIIAILALAAYTIYRVSVA
jgi:cytoskeleton protein RodZ